MQFEKAAIIEPSRSLNELIRLSSGQPQSEKIDAIIRHHEMLQSLEPCMHSVGCCCRKHVQRWLSHTSLSPHVSRFRPSAYLSIYTRPVQYGRHDKFQWVREIDSMPLKRASGCQLRRAWT